ncbi:fibronectin type III domain-containing protein [Planctomonas psychrotolerans]|uniref:fibronectin type III domain-containing protein n=1 Tax=Planctomonas psychrotolerans TaxID=2528712 RepID=UPI001D0D0F21|nr:fibronectin type III domain-containing protein [Planctomonas psychrotolerans]
MAVPAASAAVPTFPDNLVVFPDRDFITVEGYQDRVGQTATVEVSRPGVGVIGSARSVVSPGDVAFEINHPGGVCWGAGTGLNVTPDIRHGDTVAIKFGTSTVGDSKVQPMYVTEVPVLASDGVTLTVTGHIDDAMIESQTEQRIVEPAFKDTAVGRRDVRAVPGPLTPEDGYSSMLEFGKAGPETFTATYVFTDPEAAQIAANAGAGVRAMSWQFEDGDANRQGLTISEFGEIGGPGMGGCPNGPLTSGPAGPTSVVAARTNSAIKLTWTPAVGIPGTPPITGYRVHAVAQTVTGGERLEMGKRIDNPRATGTTISGLNPDETYDVYVVSVNAAGETFPAVHAIPVVDTTAPTVSATPAGGTFRTAQKLTLTANEAGAEIYYTLDESDVFLSGGTLSTVAILYTAPLDITADSVVNVAAVDVSGNISDQKSVEFIITNEALPSAPSFSAAPEAGTGSVTLSWAPADPGGDGLTITGYSVQAYLADGSQAGEPRSTAGDVTTLVFDGLAGDTEYAFTVSALNANGTGPESERTAPVMVLGDVVANAGTDQSITRAPTATTVTLDGSRSTSSNATYLWEQVLTGSTDPDRVTLTGATTLTPSFSLRVFAHPMTNNPLTFRLTVTSNGVVRTDQVKVTPVPDRIAVARAQWKSRDFRIEGTGSVDGATVTIRRGGPTGTVISRSTVTAGVFSARLRDGAAGTNPGTIWVESSLGGSVSAAVTAG